MRADATETAADTSQRLTTLRSGSSNAVAGLRTQVAALEGQPRHGQRHESLLNLKAFEPKTFAGKEADNVKPWAKKTRNYCNARRKGFRTALDWAELQTEPITVQDLIGMDWAPAEEANLELYDFLVMATSDEALLIVERHKDNGFEAWRQLLRRYNPTGGRFELDRMAHLLQRKQCKTLSEVPAAVDVLERDMLGYETRSSVKFPEEWKLPLLLQILPETHRKELEVKFSMGEKNYSKIVANIVGYSNEHRVASQRRKNPDGGKNSSGKPL